MQPPKNPVDLPERKGNRHFRVAGRSPLACGHFPGTRDPAKELCDLVHRSGDAIKPDVQHGNGRDAKSRIVRFEVNVCTIHRDVVQPKRPVQVRFVGQLC